MTYRDFKDLTRKIAVDKVLHYKAFNIAKNPKYDGYQRGLASTVFKFFDKKTADGAVKNEIMQNKELAEELHKPIIIKLEKQKVSLSFIHNIWGVDVADFQIISIFNKGIHFLLCVINIFSKYAWVIPLKDEIVITITIVFQN